MAHGDPVAQKIAAVLAFFLVFLLASAERGHRARKGEFSIQIERERLSAALTAEKEKFKDLAAELDARVQTRTGQLTELNEKLQAEVFERGEAERAARSQKARFTAAFENAPVGMIIAYQATGEIVKANSAVCELLGYKTAELAKMRLVSLLCPSEREHGTTDLFSQRQQRRKTLYSSTRSRDLGTYINWCNVGRRIYRWICRDPNTGFDGVKICT